MIRALVTLASVFIWCGAAGGDELQPKVNVDRNAPLICPIDDCYLTLVDETLCSILDAVFDDNVSEFSNILNCIDSEKGQTYACLNVLSKKRYSEERKAYYSDPYLLQLMTDFQVRLDNCLSAWKKGISLAEDRQTITYEMGKAHAVLGLTEYVVDGTKYDRLTLELGQAPLK